jgi:hypothetical protein
MGCTGVRAGVSYFEAAFKENLHGLLAANLDIAA